MNDNVRSMIRKLYKQDLIERPLKKMRLNLKFNVRLAIRIGLTTILLLVVIASYFFCDFIQLQQSIFAQGSKVEVEYQRRGNLVPRLTEITKKYSQHERALMNYVADARELKKSSEKIKDLLGSAKAAQADKIFSKLVALAEQYPDLKAEQSYQALMTKIQTTENRVATEREKYTVMINDYNRKVQTFPFILFAHLFSLEKVNVYNSDKDPMPEQDKRFYFIY